MFFAVAHDPTLIDRQGPDVGPEYRSAIFVRSAERPGVTLGRFRAAAEDQQYRKP